MAAIAEVVGLANLTRYVMQRTRLHAGQSGIADVAVMRRFFSSSGMPCNGAPVHHGGADERGL